MTDAEFDALEPDDDFYRDVGQDVWLMDNHKWALLIWDRFYAMHDRQKLVLFHADYHWDGVSDFHGNPAEEERIRSASEALLRQLITDEDGVQYDSFIAPAVLRGVLSHVHFYCKQDDGSDVGIDPELLQRMGTQQVIYESADALAAANVGEPLIFDLCLDLFNKSDHWYESDLWSDEEISDFLGTVKPLIERAVVVTVSLSFGYSGDEDDTRRLAKFVIPKILEWRAV